MCAVDMSLKVGPVSTSSCETRGNLPSCSWVELFKRFVWTSIYNRNITVCSYTNSRLVLIDTGYPWILKEPHLEERKKRESLQWHSLAFLSLPACVVAPNDLPQAKTPRPSWEERLRKRKKNMACHSSHPSKIFPSFCSHVCLWNA